MKKEFANIIRIFPMKKWTVPSAFASRRHRRHERAPECGKHTVRSGKYTAYRICGGGRRTGHGFSGRTVKEIDSVIPGAS